MELHLHRNHLLLMGLFLLALTGCASGEKSNLTSDSILFGTTWQLEQYGALDDLQPVSKGIAITLIINDDGELSGNAGCNTYRGSSVVQDQELSISGLSSTKKLCPDPPEAMDHEREFLSLLNSIESFEIAKDSLTLSGADGQGLVFRASGV